MTGSTHRIRRSLRIGAMPRARPARVRALTDRLVSPDTCLCWRLGGLLIRLSRVWRPPKPRVGPMEVSG